MFEETEIVEPPIGPRLDTGSLQKGDVLSTEFCEKHLGIARDHALFQPSLNLLGLSVQRLRGDLLVSTKGGVLKIMTDEESLGEYNRRARSRLLSQLSDIRNGERIVRGNLSELSQARLDGLRSYNVGQAIHLANSLQKVKALQNTKAAVQQREQQDRNRNAYQAKQLNEAFAAK